MTVPTEKLGSAAARMQRPLRYILLESLLIALSVLFALFAQDWRERREQKELGHQALASIREEMVRNRELLAQAAEYHQAKAHMIEGYFAKQREDPTAHPLPQDFEKGFVNPAHLLDVAWETARATDALHTVAYDDLLAIAAVYDAQKVYFIQSERSGELIYKDMYELGSDGIAKKFRSVYMLLRAFLYRETGDWSLQPQYDAAIEQIDGLLKQAGR